MGSSEKDHNSTAVVFGVCSHSALATLTLFFCILEGSYLHIYYTQPSISTSEHVSNLLDLRQLETGKQWRQRLPRNCVPDVVASETLLHLAFGVGSPGRDPSIIKFRVWGCFGKMFMINIWLHRGCHQSVCSDWVLPLFLSPFFLPVNSILVLCSSVTVSQKHLTLPGNCVLRVWTVDRETTSPGKQLCVSV